MKKWGSLALKVVYVVLVAAAVLATDHYAPPMPFDVL